MKHFSRYLYLIGLLCSLSVARADVPMFIVNGESYTHMSHVCMPHVKENTITVSYNANGASVGKVRWQAIGDLKLITPDSLSPATFETTGPGKGVARLHYSNANCGAAIDLHVYKEFDPEAQGLVIEGPDCLTPGEIVVFSVRPILTRNLNAYIGVDSYFWNLTDTGAAKPSFVDRIVYAAGDGSSVTFVAGTVHAGDEVRVNFGECNTSPDKTITKTLGKVPPKPEVADLLCVPYGGAPVVRIYVNNPIEGVDYTCQVPSQYKSARVSSTSVTAFDITFDKGSADDISIRAMYKDEAACGSSESVVRIVRTWGASVALKYKGADGVCCAEVSPSSSYEFELTGDIPTGSQIYWDLPNGWEQDTEHSAGHSIHIRPTTAAAPMGTLRAWGDACNNEAADTASIVVYVKPASVAAIEGPACVSIGVPDTFRVALNNDGSTPVAYRWTTSDGQNLTAYTGEYALITPTANTTTISVQPLGLKCDAAVFTKTLAFMPVAPTGIVAAHCIAAGVSDTVTLSIEGAQPNQNYEWELPNDITYVSGNNSKSTIVVKTNGIAGNSTVQAHAVSSCGSTNPASLTLHTGDVLFYLDIYSRRTSTMVYTYPEVLEDTITESPIAYYEWYLNDELISQGPAQYDVTLNTADAVGTIRLVVTLENGCKQSAMTSFSNALMAPKSNSATETIAQELEELHIAPNPAQNTMRVDFPSKAQKTIVRIYGISGQHVSRFVTTDTYADIDTSSFPNGIYTIVISQDGVIHSADFIVQH